MSVYLDDSGRPLPLGTILGQGGEGAVYEISGDAAFVAKIYHKPLDQAHATKLTAMIRCATPEVTKVAAWPRKLVVKGGYTVGVVMPRVDPGNRPVHELYSPKDRLRRFPAADCAFLIHAASNVAKGFAVIHSAGHVIGDVNHGNILVSGRGVSAFIDCDSFQISSNGRIFPCGVGVSTFTPPELQSVTDLGAVRRTQNHDAFGLAVLVFHLLFMGRHPFAGKFLGSGDMPIERAIKEVRFPFGRLATQVQMSPPPNSLTLNQVPPEVARAFERAFSKEAASGFARPTSKEWIATLDSFRNQLARCSKNKAHLYYSRLSSCPLCPIEDNGAVLFIEIGTFADSSFDLDQLWKRLTSSAFQAELPSVPTTSTTAPAVASAESKRTGRRRRTLVWSGLGLVALSVIAVSISNLDSELGFFGVLVTIFVAIMLPQNLFAKRQQLSAQAKAARRTFDELCAQYEKECSAEPLTTQLRNLERTRSDYLLIPEKRRQKLVELERNKRHIQLEQFLDNCSLRNASIAGIGPGRKQMLAAYGVDSAADVTPQKIFQVPGIGVRFGERLLAWRVDEERKFRFDPAKPTDKVLIAKVEQEFKSLRSVAEQNLKKGIEDLIPSRARLVARRDQYQKLLKQSFGAFLQADANARAS